MCVYLNSKKSNYKIEEGGFSSLAKIGDIAGQPYRLDFLFSSILDTVKKMLAVETAFFMLLDERNGLLSIKAASGLSEEAVRDLRVKVGEGIAGWVAGSGEIFLDSGVVTENKFSESPEGSYGLYQGKSILSVPIKIKKRTVGVVTLTRPVNEAFKQKDKELLLILASYAAQAIEKNELYREIDYVMAKLQAIQARYGRYEER